MEKKSNEKENDTKQQQQQQQQQQIGRPELACVMLTTLPSLEMMLTS